MLGLDAKPAEGQLATRKHIPVAGAMLVGNEKACPIDCLQSTWISSSGKYVEQFGFKISAGLGTLFLAAMELLHYTLR
jgi:hypothetical protein